ncbi:MAG: acyltransferase, partial [Actinobacteria bacterium]
MYAPQIPHFGDPRRVGPGRFVIGRPAEIRRSPIRFVRPARPGEPGRREGFRYDIEGLRGVAVLLVVLWHAGVPGFSAGFVGVDVFFVISGFLITRLIATEIATRGRLSLLGFYGRRARRLLPSAGLVLCASALLGYLLLPPIRWRDTAGDVIASALYVVNWRFAERAVDYLAADQAPSIVQHYWSLAVEEQFYLLWPLLLILVAAVARRRGRPHGFVAAGFVVVALLVVVSFGWSLLLTATDPARAYFDTTVRIWELGVGALLALWPTALRMPPAVAAGLGWVGLLALVGAAVVFDTRTPFPGAAALVPTVGTALVIVAGGVAGAPGPERLLRRWPLTALGRISYPLYLWHWPLLVVCTARYGELSLPAALLVVGASLLLAEVTGRFVERPIRRARIFRVDPQMAIQAGLACTIVSLIAGFVLLIVAVPPPPQVSASVPDGAEAVRSGANAEPVDRVPHITPDPLVARDDLPDVYTAGCHVTRQESAVRGCTYGNPASRFT